MSMQHLKTPVDLASMECVTPADIQQALETAYPFEKQGFVIWSQTAPNVILNPELEYFFWGKLDGDGVKTKEFYFYNGTSWELIPLVDGNLLADGTVALSKLKLTGSSPYYIIQVNGTGTALIWTSIINAIQNNTLPPAKLLSAGVGDFILTSFAGVKAFTTIASFFSTIADKVIPNTKINVGGANTFLRTKADASNTEWTTVDVSDLLAAGAVAGQSIKRNPGNTGWTFYTPATMGKYEFNNGGAYYTFPTSATSVVIAHGLGAKPALVRVVAICITGVDGYTAGDEIELTSITADADGTDQYVALGVTSDATNITVSCIGYVNGLFYSTKTGSAATAFDTTKWKLKVYAFNG